MIEARSESETTELEAAQRRRAAAAFVLITASLAVGVLIGRLSASVVPAEPVRLEASTAAKPSGLTSQPTKPLAAATQATPATPSAPAVTSQGADRSAQASAPSPQPPKLALTKDLAGSENAPPPTMQVISAAIGDPAAPSAQDPAASTAGADDSKVSVINPGAGDAVRDTKRDSGKTTAPATMTDNRTGSAPQQTASSSQRLENGPPSSGVEECERRYSSFRREDGTYQPFDGGPRRRCPHLR